MSDQLPGMTAESPEVAAVTVRLAFGEANRARLLREYFHDVGSIEWEDAWKHIYRLLLWIDRTTGLVHCYESDKSQPGRPWYPRSLAFHGWVAEQLGTTPGYLAGEIDWLFRRVIADLATIAVARTNSDRVQQQRTPFEGRGFPSPGDDPELIEIILETLSEWMEQEPPQAVKQQLAQRVLVYVRQENKRKNLIGEGFEDSLAAVLRRIPGFESAYEIRTRPLLHTVDGFREAPPNQKPRQVDLVLIRRSDGRRILITAKWSVRADREEQFVSDFRDYAQFESSGKDFEYVWITNEFDAARLVNACTRRRENALLFTDVVHIQPSGPALAYRNIRVNSEQSATEMYRHIKDGRLSSFGSWIAKLLQ